jgi:NADPH-dependent FMN reductase
MNDESTLENPPFARPVSHINVLVITDSNARHVSRTLSQLAIALSPSGISVNVFDRLRDLPRYDENQEISDTPEHVVALRCAADQAHAALVVTQYYNRVPTTVHNVIDWLTRGGQSALADKPLAVIGRAAGYYSGVWSHHQVDDAQAVGEVSIVEPITVASLDEAVRKLASEACAVDGAKAEVLEWLNWNADNESRPAG